MEEEKKVVLILGAGFSKAVSGYFPLTDTLGESVRDKLNDKDKEKLPKKFENGRFEEWFSYISEMQPHFDIAQNLENEALVYKITEAIQKVLLEVQAEVVDNISYFPPLWFLQFIHVLHIQKATVVTLNYDNLMEYGINKLNVARKDYYSIYSVTENDILRGLPPATYEARTLAFNGRTKTKNAISLTRDTFELLKLHGSLSWYWLPESKGNSTIERWKFDNLSHDADSPELKETLPAHKPFIVPPTNLKGRLLEEPVMRELWKKAKVACDNADRIILIGYSLPKADTSIAGLLSDGITGRNVQVEIVNPFPREIKKRLISLGAQADAIMCFCEENCVEKWTQDEANRLAKELPKKLCRDVEAIREKNIETCVLSFTKTSCVVSEGALEIKETPDDHVVLCLASGKQFSCDELIRVFSDCSYLEIEGEGLVLDYIQKEPPYNKNKVIFELFVLKKEI